MAASVYTVRALLDVLEIHLGPETIKRVLNDLVEVDGNSSFRLTVRALLAEANYRYGVTDDGDA